MVVIPHGHGFSGLTLFPNRNIVNRCVGKSVCIGTHIGEDKILPAQPVGCSIFARSTHVIAGHGADFFTVHEQIHHIAAIGSNMVFQSVSMQRCPVDAVVSQSNAVVVAARGGLFTHSDDAVGIALENIAGIVLRVHIGGGKQSGATGGCAVLPCARALPFHCPRLIMQKHDLVFQPITSIAEHSVRGSARILSQCIVPADADQLVSVKFPAVVLGLKYGFRSDRYIVGHRINGNNAVCIALSGNISATHGHGHSHTSVCGQIYGIAITADDNSVVTVVRRYSIRFQGNGVRIYRVSGVRHQRPLEGLGIGIHAQSVGVDTAVTDIGVEVLHGDGAAVDIHNVDTEMLHNLLQLLIEGSDQLIRSVHALGDVQIVNLRTGVSDGDFMQHNGSSLQRGCRCGIGIGSVTVVGDQSIIVNIGSAEGILIILEVIGTHLDADDIGHFSRILAGIVVKLYAAIHISTLGAVAFIEQRGAAPGIVHQQAQTHVAANLHPPCVIEGNVRHLRMGIVLGIAANGGVGGIRCRTIGGAAVGRNACAQNRESLTLQSGSCFPAFCASAVFVGMAKRCCFHRGRGHRITRRIDRIATECAQLVIVSASMDAVRFTSPHAYQSMAAGLRCIFGQFRKIGNDLIVQDRCPCCCGMVQIGCCVTVKPLACFMVFHNSQIKVDIAIATFFYPLVLQAIVHFRSRRCGCQYGSNVVFFANADKFLCRFQPSSMNRAISVSVVHAKAPYRIGRLTEL